MKLTDLQDMCHWLAANVSAIASSENAGELFRELRGHKDAIEGVVNRPDPPQVIGACWGPDLKNPSQPCGMRLLARREDKVTTCERCKFEYTTSDVHERSEIILRYHPMPKKEILDVMRDVPRQSFERWVSQEKLHPCGVDKEGEPLYRIADVRPLRDATKPRVRKLARA